LPTNVQKRDGFYLVALPPHVTTHEEYC